MIYGAWIGSLSDLPCLESPETGVRNSPQMLVSWQIIRFFGLIIVIRDLDPYPLVQVRTCSNLDMVESRLKMVPECS